MKPQELRIGNYVHPCSPPNPVIIPQTGIINQVFEIKWDGAELFNRIDKHPACQQPFFYEWNRISPIPLTEELLRLFGIKKHGSDDGTDQWWLMEKSSESYTGEICLLSLSWHCHKNFFFYQSLNHKIHHVHQLQNLVNVLTGKELILKPEKETV